MNILYIHVECPYCGTTQHINTDIVKNVSQYGLNLTLCYPEEGGCDRYFVYRINASITSKSYKIQDQEEK